MIEPFVDRLERDGVISYGLSSFGYDLRAAPEWRIFVNAFNTVVDPKHFDARSLVEVTDDTCIIPPNSFALTRSVEYLRIPDDTMVIALGKSSYARCFRGDTRVALVDGTAPTLAEMAAASSDGEMHFGYALGPNGQLLVTHLDAPRFVGRDSIVEIELDDGTRVHSTEDHGFMLRDGSWRSAGDLTPETSLMPLYRDVFRGYEMTHQPLTGHSVPTHRLADAWNVRHGFYDDTSGTHRHHVDHDRRNNNPWNLVRMQASDHIRYHNAEHDGSDVDPIAHAEAIKASFERRRKDPAWRAHMSAVQGARTRAFWSDPAYAAQRDRLIERRRSLWQDPELRARQAARQEAYWQDNDEARSAQGHRSRFAWKDAPPERRARQADIARGLRLRPDIGEAEVVAALQATGSIRGAARALGRDRSVFRRFPEAITRFRGLPVHKNHRVKGVRHLRGEEDVFCLTVPEAGNFALAAGVFVANCGIVANVTPLEPGWEGHVTLELSNTTPLPAKVYANEGIVQLLFFQGERPEVTYRDRKGKYQGQRGVTLPKL